MKLNMWTVVWKFITGFTNGGVSVADYVLGLINTAVNQLSDPTKDNIRAVLNFAMKALAVLNAVRCFIPAKWQIAYAATIDAVAALVEVLSDLAVTKEELDKCVAAYRVAYDAWTGPDDETCVEMVELPDGTFAARRAG